MEAKGLNILNVNQTMTISGRKDIEVLSGKLWVTYEGDSEDHFYKAGEKFTTPARGLTVIQALDTSTLTEIVHGKHAYILQGA